MSATVIKALSLLDLFTESAPELGLTEVTQLSDFDKATTHRLLSALASRGFLEQHPETRFYRLGPQILRLARLREATFPISTIVQPVLEALAAATGETAHLSLLAGGVLVPVCVVESQKANRVSLSPSEILPLYATASGIAFMAFSADGFAAKALQGRLKAYTEHTSTSREEILRQVEAARRIGYATADQSYEEEVYGIAAPVFGPGGNSSGAIAVSTPRHRVTRDLKALIIHAVMDAAVDVSGRIGNKPPVAFIKLCLHAAA